MLLVTNLYSKIRFASAFIIVLLSVSSFTISLNAQTFTGVGSSITAVGTGYSAWGDFDNDGDLDIAVIGATASNRIAKIYRNDGGTFSIFASLTPVSSGSVAWGDYDNDGDLDLLLTGYGGSSSPYVAKLYRNDITAFTEVITSITPVNSSSAAWGDFDNDGDLDILLAGITTDSITVTKIFQNNNGTFSDANASLTGTAKGTVAWGDYDNDGDLDILQTGFTGTILVAKIYQNTNGVFSDISANIDTLGSGSAAWGDYDNDGDLDVLICGKNANGKATKIYQNSGGNFNDISAALPGISSGIALWSDINLDGVIDVVLTGADTDSTRISRIYKDSSGTYVDISASIVGLSNSFISLGDYDNDNDLDIFICGDSPTTKISRIYQNGTDSVNTAPSSPTGLSATVLNAKVTLRWNKSTDSKTPKNGLTYAIRIGSTSEGVEIVSPFAQNDSTGFRTTFGLGNTNHDTSWVINNLQIGTFYWSVQAIDNSNVGSPFAVEKTFVIPDSNGYRTFSAGSGLGGKSVKMVINTKTGMMKTSPNHLTAVENLFTKLPKKDNKFLGVEQITDSAKFYAWVAYKKASELAKLFTGIHNLQSYPLDYKPGSTTRLKKAIKASRNQYNNPAIEQGVLFNLNLLSSANNITPPEFGNLILTKDGYLAGKNMKGENLTAIGLFLDSIMTYWEKYNITNVTAYNSTALFVETVLKPINNFFAADFADTNILIDSNAVKGINTSDGKKKPYAITLQGVKSPTDSGSILNPPSAKTSSNAILQMMRSEIPHAFSLEQNYPNPFNPTTKIEFSLPFSSYVTLKVYNTLGQVVATLLNNEATEDGKHEITFDANKLSSGVYFYRITGSTLNDNTTFESVKKMLLIK
jgi:hypothetical protein